MLHRWFPVEKESATIVICLLEDDGFLLPRCHCGKGQSCADFNRIAGLIFIKEFSYRMQERPKE